MVVSIISLTGHEQCHMYGWAVYCRYIFWPENRLNVRWILPLINIKYGFGIRPGQCCFHQPNLIVMIDGEVGPQSLRTAGGPLPGYQARHTHYLPPERDRYWTVPAVLRDWYKMCPHLWRFALARNNFIMLFFLFFCGCVNCCFRGGFFNPFFIHSIIYLRFPHRLRHTMTGIARAYLDGSYYMSTHAHPCLYLGSTFSINCC